MAHTFPIDSETSFEQISEKCGLNLIDTKRILRHAMTNHIFKEEKPGIVTHTAASKLLAENRLMEDFVGISCEEKFRAQAHVRFPSFAVLDMCGLSLSLNLNWDWE